MRGISLLALIAAPALSAATCDSLASLQLPHASVTLAQTVAAGAFPVQQGAKGGNPFANLPEFCRVAVTSRPSSDSEIKIEVWLPAASGWNSNFLANGNGGWTGSISPNTLANGLRRGFASAMSDLGHEGGSASFALGHPEKVIDFGYRATHEMAVFGKEIVKAYYGQPAKVAYYDGCSAGGRQGLMEAQRYPQDFDAIVAGSPGLNWSGRAMQSIWVAQVNLADAAHTLPREKFAIVHEAVVAACDTADGVKDGVLENPRKCNFDPAKLACANGADAPNCLTAGQVDTVRRIYMDVTNPRTKETYFPGHEPGSELGWNTMAGAQPFGPGADLFKYVVFQDANWDWKTLNFDTDMPRTRQASRDMDAMDTNLKPFFDRGGRLIQYHGWSDPQISPRSSVEYYEGVTNRLGNKLENYRLFMVPGMAHCGGGEGTSVFDMLGTMQTWVEKNQPPASIAAARQRNGQTDRTRPLCPYPQQAVYKGTGSTDEAANFSCRLP